MYRWNPPIATKIGLELQLVKDHCNQGLGRRVTLIELSAHVKVVAVGHFLESSDFSNLDFQVSNFRLELSLKNHQKVILFPWFLDVNEGRLKNVHNLGLSLFQNNHFRGQLKKTC